MELDKFPSYGEFFFLRNRDPGNNVLYKDFYFYSIIMIYVFYFWYIVAVLDNEEQLTQLNSTSGEVIFYLTLLVSIGTSLILCYMTLSKKEYPSSWAGIVFILLLISMGMCLFTRDFRELDANFEKDPSRLAAAFLLSYTFVSYFFVK